MKNALLCGITMGKALELERGMVTWLTSSPAMLFEELVICSRAQPESVLSQIGRKISEVKRSCQLASIGSDSQPVFRFT